MTIDVDPQTCNCELDPGPGSTPTPCPVHEATTEAERWRARGVNPRAKPKPAEPDRPLLSQAEASEWTRTLESVPPHYNEHATIRYLTRHIRLGIEHDMPKARRLRDSAARVGMVILVRKFQQAKEKP